MALDALARRITITRGLADISLGMALCKKPNKTPEEALAAKSFVQMFRAILVMVAVFVVVMLFVTGWAMKDPVYAYPGYYAEVRIGRIENGKIRYIKNELHYLEPEAIGLSPADCAEGTHIRLYFDKNDRVLAGENNDVLMQDRVRRIGIYMIVLCMSVAGLIIFRIVAGKTIGKLWFAWLKAQKAA